jgi:hypothetical protein
MSDGEDKGVLNLTHDDNRGKSRAFYSCINREILFEHLCLFWSKGDWRARRWLEGASTSRRCRGKRDHCRGGPDTPPNGPPVDSHIGDGP